jgi:hypothetical protein
MIMTIITYLMVIMCVCSLWVIGFALVKDHFILNGARKHKEWRYKHRVTLDYLSQHVQDLARENNNVSVDSEHVNVRYGIHAWCTEQNAKYEWDKDYQNKTITIAFKKVEDAVQFKLEWV